MPEGLWIGEVTNLSDNYVVVEVPRLGRYWRAEPVPDIEFEIGDRVVCGFFEAGTERLIIIRKSLPPSIEEPPEEIEYMSDRRLPTGESTIPAYATNGNNAGFVSQQLKLVYFTCQQTRTVSKVALYVGTVPASGTITQSRLGVWLIDSGGNFGANPLGSTPNNIALFTGSANSRKEQSFSAPFQIVKDNRYAIGLNIVGSGTMPTFIAAFLGNSVMSAGTQRLAGEKTGIATLPDTVTAPISNSSSVIYMELLE